MPLETVGDQEVFFTDSTKEALERELRAVRAAAASDASVATLVGAVVRFVVRTARALGLRVQALIRWQSKMHGQGAARTFALEAAISELISLMRELARQGDAHRRHLQNLERRFKELENK